MKIHTVSRDNLYEAVGDYDGNVVVVRKGSRINISPCPKYNPSSFVAKLRMDGALVDADGILMRDVTFPMLSTAAAFVTGRTANGMIVWKTEDGRYIRYSLEGE